MSAAQAQAPRVQPRRAETLARHAAWRLLASAALGRVVFTLRALPAIRPVNHVVDGDQIIIRTDQGAVLTPEVDRGTVVAYEVDDIDPVLHTGWSVIVLGMTSRVTDPELIQRYTSQLQPWVAGRKDYVIRINPAFVTGVRLVAGDE